MTASHVVKVPDVGEGVAEVELVTWAVEVGQQVQRNDVIAEVMTDKATVEVPAPVDGTVERLDGTVGDVILVGTELFTLLVDNGDLAPEAEQATEPTSNPATEVLTTAVTTLEIPPADQESASAESPHGPRPRATPAIRRRARDAGVELAVVSGTGPAGRVTHQDLDHFLTGKAGPLERPAPAVHASGKPDSVVEQPLVGIRRKIAERMTTAVSTIPHITYIEEVDVTSVEQLRAHLNDKRQDDQPKLTLLPFLIRAIVNAVSEHPHLNAHVDDEAGLIRQFSSVHLGIATQTESGLVVPVLRRAQDHTVWSTAAAVADLAERARSGSAKAEEMRGSTITITSLGSLGGIATTPILNKPEVAIVGTNKIVTRPVWSESGGAGQFIPRKIMNLSSSFDHRVIDGWDAAQFIQTTKNQLEQPALLFMGED